MRLSTLVTSHDLQPDQINMAVFFWYLLKSDLAGVRYLQPYRGQVAYSRVPETSVADPYPEDPNPEKKQIRILQEQNIEQNYQNIILKLRERRLFL